MKIRIRVLLLGLLGMTAAGFAVGYPRTPVDPAEVAPELAPVYAPPIETAASHVVRRGETLSEVFTRARLTPSDMNRLLLAMREHVNPRRIMPNTPIVVRRWVEDGSFRAVEIELNADTVVRLEPSALGWSGAILETPIHIDTVSIAAELGPGESLNSAVIRHPDLDLPLSEKEGLVWQLAHIYGWEVDFAHDIRPGDAFRVVYEREARPDGTSRRARVLVAEVVNQGRTLAAVFFDPEDNGGDYFNAEGKSLRLAFLRYPVDYPRVTSNFNWRRYHPILKRNRPHLGTDFGTGRGAPVRSTADGVIRFAAWDGGYGNLIKVNHGNGYETRYAHLSRFAPGIRPGRRVKQGQIIGYSGDTGLATAPHLHYEMRQYGNPMDPRKVRLPSAPPVPAEHMDAFEDLAGERAGLLPPPVTPPTGTDR
jgi:murein DD-endopeptidase MepM/ murein hydrolase activator NlpD